VIHLIPALPETACPMRRLSYIVSLPLAILLILFAIDNRDALEIKFWPLSWTVSLPAFLALFLALLLGFLAGALAAWFSGAKGRQRARGLAETARAQAHQIAEHERRQGEGQAARSRAVNPPPR
jgi:uncharacterized integral membrane protein